MWNEEKYPWEDIAKVIKISLENDTIIGKRFRAVGGGGETPVKEAIQSLK
ncbi:hypothetical protein [Oceanobacillus jeddahense]|uniref:Uncharacterized protein n=1 Tax=Oceanobacillus jeddahense TaxID=1462527 RepID=A0ABY5JWG4_9BACI|nr:hypothetical protein [Oceanobacillus jeddahense]UUI04728.1 hypothetical protein NP439_08860 [Oceanobacillus jeddahense]